MPIQHSLEVILDGEFLFPVIQMEKTKHLLYQAKCGHFGQADALYALQRDSDLQKDTSFGELAVKSMYDDQLIQLENLITTQHDAQHRMREQLAALEKRYHKVNHFRAELFIAGGLKLT